MNFALFTVDDYDIAVIVRFIEDIPVLCCVMCERQKNYLCIFFIGCLFV